MVEQFEDGKPPQPVCDAIFAASLKTSWGVLGMMSSDGYSWVWPQARWAPFLDAALGFWDELDAVGARYYWTRPERLWGVARGLHYVMANMGVPNDVLGAPLPPGGPRALLRYAQPVASA